MALIHGHLSDEGHSVVRYELGTLARMDVRGARSVDAWFLGALFSGLFAAPVFFTRVVRRCRSFITTRTR
jgi:hypothetical protein